LLLPIIITEVDGVVYGIDLYVTLPLINEAISKLKELGCAVLVGASRKSMIGKIIPSETDERLPGTIALHTAAILKGADVIRVHDVKEAVQAARVADRLRGL
jgi:dihydropteroate synthase